MQSVLEPWYTRCQIQGYEKSNIDEIIINSKRFDDAATFQKGLRSIFCVYSADVYLKRITGFNLWVVLMLYVSVSITVWEI